MILIEKRKKAAELAGKMKQIGDAYNERKAKQEKDPSVALWPDNSRSEWDSVCKEYDTLKDEIKQLEDDESVNARINEVNKWEQRSQQHGKQKPGLDDINPSTGREFGEDYSDRDEARAVAQRAADQRQYMRSFIAAQINEDLITPAMQEACERLKANPQRQSLRGKLLDTESYRQLQMAARNTNQQLIEQRLGQLQAESRAMSKAGVGVGAELVPVTFINAVELAMLATSPFFAYVDMMRTETGEDMKFPTADDTANEGQQIGAEATDISGLPQPDATLAQLTMRAFDFTSGMIAVSEQLNRDSLYSIDLLLANLIGQRLGRIKLRRATTGNATTQPGGIVTQAAAGITTALATAITADETIRLQHSVDPEYRSGGAYMANDAIIAALRLLKDTQGRYLWSSGLRDGLPDLLNGQPIVYNQFMASTIATTNVTMVYGNFRYYKAREVGNILIKRLAERAAEKMQILFMGYQAFDGRLMSFASAATAPVKKLTQA
jgi:HK97 family phage major capsid protein